MARYYFNKTITRITWKNRLLILLGRTLSVSAYFELDNHTGHIKDNVVSDYNVENQSMERDETILGKLKDGVEMKTVK